MSIRERQSKKHGITYQVYFTYTDTYTNERKIFTKSGFVKYDDALLYEKRKKQELNTQSNYIKKYKITIDEVFDEWLLLEANYKYQENTIIDYKRRYYHHIQNILGNILITELDYKRLQVYFNNNKNLGISTNYKLKEILNVIINFAIKCNYIDNNYLKLVHITGIKNNRNNNQIYSNDDFNNIIDILLNNPSDIRYAYIVALYIGKYTGLRISEVFALNRDDFDFSLEIIHINKKMIYADKKRNELIISNEMKTNASQSILPFHKELQIIINKWFEYHKHNYVISDSNGNLLNPKQLEYTLWKISKQLGIHFHFHVLRHTLATKLVASGANMKATQEIMRHASITTTMNIYTHVNQANKKEALYQAFPIDNK